MGILSENEKKRLDVLKSGFKLNTLHNAVPIPILVNEKTREKFPMTMHETVGATRRMQWHFDDFIDDYYLLSEPLPPAPRSGKITVLKPVHAVNWPDDTDFSQALIYGDCDGAETFVSWTSDDGEHDEVLQNAFLKLVRGDQSEVTIERGHHSDGKPFSNIHITLAFRVFIGVFDPYDSGGEDPLMFKFEDVEITEIGFKARITHIYDRYSDGGFRPVYDKLPIPAAVGGEG
jgi:hypothetical protein